MDYYQDFQKKLEAKEQEKNKRTIKTYEPLDAVRVKRDDRMYIMMASNNYLGLTHEPRVQQAAMQAIQRYGTGSGGARLTSGSFPLFKELEIAIANFKGTEQSLVFNKRSKFLSSLTNIFSNLNLLYKYPGIIKSNIDQSSKRLFSIGVPVSANFDFAFIFFIACVITESGFFIF